MIDDQERRRADLFDWNRRFDARVMRTSKAIPRLNRLRRRSGIRFGVGVGLFVSSIVLFVLALCWGKL